MIEKVTDKRLLKGILTIFFGSFSARVIGIVSIPLLTRIYSPEDYGVLAVFVAFTTLISTVSGLRFSQAVPLPKSDIIAFHVFFLGLFSSFIVAALLVLIFSLMSDSIFELFNAEKLSKWWWLAIVGGLSISIFENLTMWSVRMKSYKLISTVQVKQSVVGEFIKIVVGLAGMKPLGLMLGHFAGQCFGANSYVRENFSFFRSGIKQLELRKLLFLVKYFSSFVFYRLPSDLLLIISVQAPAIMATKLYGSAMTGQLALTLMALGLPVSLIGAAVARVYYAEISSIGRHNKKEIKRITIKVQKRLFVFGLPIALVVYFLSEGLFRIAFGDRWAQAGVFASALAPYLLLQFTSSPLMQLVNVLGKQFVFFALNSGRVLALVFLYCYSSTFQLTPEVFVVHLSFLLFLYYSFQSIVIFSLLRR